MASAGEITEAGEAAPEAAPGARPRPAALGFIYGAIFMNTMSMGVVIPVIPVLVKTLSHQGDAGAAQISGVFGAAWALMQLTFAPVFGNLSDRYGRRPVLLVAMFGLAFDYLVMALAPNIAWLFIGRVISGVTSSSGSSAGAYVADVSTPENRARNFGRFQAAANAGVFFGPVLGGFVGSLDPRAPFWVAAALAFANGLYGLFVVPESLSRDRRMAFSWKRANPFGAAAMLVTRKGLAGLAGIMLLVQFALSTFNAIFQFYTHARYVWGPLQVGEFMTVFSLGNILIASFGAGWAAKTIGERGAVILGLSIGVFGFSWMALAPTEVWFWSGLIPAILFGINFPNFMSLLSARVGEDEQGQLQGALQILFGVAMLVGPLAWSNLFAWSMGPGAGLHLPGLTLLIGSGLLAVSVALAVAYARPVPTANSSSAPS
jgi:DHA1 family tetracycline resistance protein-like MFS transporter